MDDLISRESALLCLTGVFPTDGKCDISKVVSKFSKRIKNLPSAEPEHIKARWLPIGMADAVGGESAMWGDEIAYHACDNCWQQALEEYGEEVLSNFCPNCGARMEVEHEQDD